MQVSTSLQRKLSHICDSLEQSSGRLIIIDAAPVHGFPGVIRVILASRDAQSLVKLELHDRGDEPTEMESTG